MANVKITDLNALTNPASTDVLPIVDVDADVTKKISVGEVVGKISGDVDVATDGTATISELPVSKLADGTARQLLQTDAAGTGVEWTSNVDVPGTLDVTGAATLDSTLDVTGLISADGKVSFPLGTAAAPSLYPGTDADTGLYSPGANQLAISTNGTERLLVTSDGKINVGSVARIEDTGEVKATNGTESDPSFSFLNDPDNGMWRPTTNTLGFSTAGTERLRITSDGKLGLGTSSPSALLTVEANSTNTSFATTNHPAGTAGILSRNVSNTVGNYQALTLLSNNGSSAQSASLVAQSVATGSAPEIHLTQRTGFNVNTTRLMVSSSGNVGIGVTSPDWTLDVNGNIGLTENSVLTWHDGSGNKAGDIYMTPTENTIFRRGASNTESMRIDSSGRLLVGTSGAVPTSYAGSGQFQIHSDSIAAAQIFTHRSTATDYPAVLDLARSRNTAASPTSVIQDDRVGSIIFWGYDGSNYLRTANIISAVDGTPGANDMPGRLVFSTTADGASSPTERMRIDSSGQVGIGDSGSAGVRLRVKASSGGGQALRLVPGGSGDVSVPQLTITKFDNNTTSSQYFVQFNINDGAAASGRIVANGANQAAFASTSDVRLKENIQDLPSQLDSILSLRPVEFDYVESEGGGHQIGFIAQELQQIYPDSVSAGSDENGYLSVTGWSKTEARLVKALQEAMERIKVLEAKVNTLEGN